MGHAHPKGENQQPHGVVQGLKPQCRHGNLGVEEGLGNHRDGVPKIAAKQHAPHRGGDAAEQEHPQRLAHLQLHVGELPQRKGAANHRQ